MSSSEHKRCLACVGTLLVLALTLTFYLADSQLAFAPLSIVRLTAKFYVASDAPVTIDTKSGPPMPMASTLRAQLAGHVHNVPWLNATESSTSVPSANGIHSIPRHVYVSVTDRNFIVSQSIANCKELNPDFDFSVVDDADIQQFVEDTAPMLLPVFSQLQGVERSDFWRYLVLWSQGGFYMDSDINCYKPFSAWDEAFHNQAKAIVGIESINPGSNRNELGFCCPVQYSNWAMASTPGHPLLEHVIDLILDFHATASMDASSNAARRRDHVIYKTGPGALSRAIEHYLALFDKYSLDVATGTKAELVGDLGVFPKVAIGSPKQSSALYSQVYVKHMFAGTWKDKT